VQILITGSNGMLGQDLVAHLQGCHGIIPVDLPEVDITVPQAIEEVMGRTRPEVVIHTAAFTAVDECESRQDLAFQVNAEGTRNVAAACRKYRIPLLYISTDYVFDGEKPEPYLEGDPPRPLNVYGHSKLEGERHVIALVEEFWIVRTSWLFGPLGKNFVRAILEKARRGGSLQVVDDQIGAPTYTMDLAATLAQLIDGAPSGLYHVTNQGYCSWFDFAREILRQAGLGHVMVSAISSSSLGRPARRPKNSRLANSRLVAEGLQLLPGWQDALIRYLKRTEQMEAEQSG